jgi:hypothetical protein
MQLVKLHCGGEPDSQPTSTHGEDQMVTNAMEKKETDRGGECWTVVRKGLHWGDGSEQTLEEEGSEPRLSGKDSRYSKWM